MQTRRLGRTDLDITPIGFGAWAIGGEWRFGWGPQDDTDSIAAIRQAVSRGVNWVDTAPAYGLGHSEEVVARALADIPLSERPHVFTKCTLVWGDDRIVRHDVVWPDGRPNSAIAAVAKAVPPPSGPPAGLARGDRRSFRVLDGGRKED